MLCQPRDHVPGPGGTGGATSFSGQLPAEYAQGAVERATRVCDVGTSIPQQWLPWLADPPLHLLVMLFAQSSDDLEVATRQLEHAWPHGCIERGRHEGTWLPGPLTHFGYRDGLSQPVIADVPLSGLPDHPPRAPVGEFLLGIP
jgi:deferrochelatase/peroxidase EfeB